MSNESVICKLADEIDKIIDRLDKLEKDGERQDRLTESLRSNCVSFGKKFYDLESSQPKESSEMPECPIDKYLREEPYQNLVHQWHFREGAVWLVRELEKKFSYATGSRVMVEAKRLVGQK